MDKVGHVGATQSEAQVATDLLAGPPMGRSDAPPPQAREADRLSTKIYAVMAVTTLLTFATLRTGYQILFSHQLFG